MTEPGSTELLIGTSPEAHPDTGYKSLYPKSDGFYHMDDEGIETKLIQELSEDLTPQLSADLNVNGYDIPGFAKDSDIEGKQNLLVSGLTIKTLNGESLLGDGNLSFDRMITGVSKPSGSSDITLTNSDNRVQYVEMTSANQFVILPDTTTLDKGYGVFVILNGGAYPFRLKDHNGNEISNDIEPGKIWNLMLLDNSESGGEWKFAIWDIIDEYAASLTGTVGTPVVFGNSVTEYTSIVALSETKAIVTYKNNSNSNYGTACVLDISGTTITPGTPVVFESAAILYNAVVRLSDTKALVVYRDGGNSNYGTACVLDISGSTITPGTPVVFESDSVLYLTATRVSDTKALAVYNDVGNDRYGTACVLDISGTTITPGTPVVFESAQTTHISVSELSETKAIVAYCDVGNSNYGTACVLDISGTTITPGTPVVFEDATSSYNSVCALSLTQAVVAYEDIGNSQKGTACVLDISGSTITPGTPEIFGDHTVSYITISSILHNTAVVAYRDDDNSFYGNFCVLGISGSTITPGTPVVFEPATTAYLSIDTVSTEKVIISYRDSGNAAKGTAVIIT